MKHGLIKHGLTTQKFANDLLDKIWSAITSCYPSEKKQISVQAFHEPRVFFAKT